MLHFYENADNSAFRKAVDRATESAASLGDHHNITFATDGELIENDWEVNADGQAFEQRITAAGGSDLLGWVTDFLAPRAQEVNDRFAREYGWDQPSVRRSDAPLSRRTEDGTVESGVERTRPRSRDGQGRGRQSVESAARDGRPGGPEASRSKGRSGGRVPEVLGERELLTPEENYHKKNEFFSAVVQGKAQAPLPGIEYIPVVRGYSENQDAGTLARFRSDYDPRQGHFDAHIARSIPGFSEIQSMVGSAIVDVYGDCGARMLDIGGSEGNLDKSISKLTDGRVETTVVDPNPDMRDAYAAGEQVEGSRYSHTASLRGEGRVDLRIR